MPNQIQSGVEPPHLKSVARHGRLSFLIFIVSPGLKAWAIFNGPLTRTNAMQAPRARNAKAWGTAPGNRPKTKLALKERNKNLAINICRGSFRRFTASNHI